MPPTASPEESLIRAFLLPERRARLLALLASPKRRRKLTAGLAHFAALDPRFATRIDPARQSSAAILALLRERGAPPTCFLLSESADLDGREMPLADALNAVVGRGMGTLISCLPGRLGYYEGEEPGEGYVLARPVERIGSEASS